MTEDDDVTSNKVVWQIVSCKMNDIDPQAWMADVLARMPDITAPTLERGEALLAPMEFDRRRLAATMFDGRIGRRAAIYAVDPAS